MEVKILTLIIKKHLTPSNEAQNFMTCSEITKFINLIAPRTYNTIEVGKALLDLGYQKNVRRQGNYQVKGYLAEFTPLST